MAQDYTDIDNPYDNNLERSEGSILADVEPSSESGQISTPGEIKENVIGAQQVNDLQITNWIKSRNYQPKVSGFLLRGSDGYIEANKLFIGSGGIIGGKLDIPDDTTANSFHVETDGDTFWGTTPALFTTSNDNATAYVLKTGVAKFQSVTLSGSVAISGIANDSNTDIALLEMTHDLVFSVTDADTIAWASGTIDLSNGRQFSIDAGNTGNMAALTYIYLDPGTSSTILQTTTTYSTAIGADKRLIGTAQNQTTTASFIPFGPGQILVDGDNIGALSVVAANIAANTITAGKMNVSQLSAITADIGSITAGDITVISGGNTVALTPEDATVFISGPTGSPTVSITAAGVLTATGAIINGYVLNSKGSFGGDGSDTGAIVTNVGFVQAIDSNR